MSGPSATEKPISAKMATNSSVTCTVTSALSVWRRCSRARLLSFSLRVAIAALTRSLKSLISRPRSRRSAGLIEPRVLSSVETDPFLPSAEMRTISIAALSLAAAMSRMSACSSSPRSVTDMRSTAPTQGLELERINERTSLRLRGEPFIFHAHPPARLRIRVVDEHKPRTMHKTFTLTHHDFSVLIKKDANKNLQQRGERGYPARRRPEYLVHFRVLIRDGRDCGKAHHGMAVAMYF